jgi:hypothetical protein
MPIPDFTHGVGETEGIKETLPGEPVSGPGGAQTPRQFQMYTDSSPYPSNVSRALEDFLKYDAEQWRSGVDNKYYRVIPSDVKSTKSNQTFYVSIYVYNKKPGPGVKPAQSYANAYWVDQKIGEFQNQYIVYYVTQGQKVADPSLDYTPPPHSIPSNFAEFKKMDPQLFKKFYEAFIFQITMQMMKQLRQNQIKLREAMRSELE